MTTGSTAQSARDTAKDAREGLREVRQAASIESDLKALRDDFRRLAEQVADIVAGKGQAAWRRARGSVGDAVAGAKDKGRESVDAMRDVSDTFVDAVDESIAKRPYTTLALVAAIGFVFGATWRR
jgi:ElaB/YqjD/DUF883 family membrane-anchored ribosome-binding protein